MSVSVWAQESMYDEGVDTEITKEDISEDLLLWAQNTALKLKDAKVRLREIEQAEKREFLLSVIRESVQEAQDFPQLLLMRFTLNRALTLADIFQDHDEGMVVNLVLMPAVNQAIALYENADLPFLEEGLKDVPDTAFKPPAYAAFTKANITYLLTLSNVHRSFVGQFEILKNAVVWVAKDMKRSSATNRNPVNANLILDLKNLYTEHENIQPEEISYVINNKFRKMLLKVYEKMKVEANAADIPSFMIYFTPKSRDSFSQASSEKVPRQDSQPSLWQRWVKALNQPPIAKDYSQTQLVGATLSTGAGVLVPKDTQDQEPTQPYAMIGMDVVRYQNPETGTDAYFVRGDWRYGEGEFIREKIKIAGARWVDDESGFGVFANIVDFERDNLRNIERNSIGNLGVALHYEPFENKNIALDVNAYWSPMESENNLQLNHFNLGNASDSWKENMKLKEQEHYDQETESIRASQENADFLVRERGATIYRQGDGRDIVTPAGWRQGYGFPILTEGDRTTLGGNTQLSEKEFSAFTVDADLTMRGQFSTKDFKLGLGTTVSQMQFDDYDGRYPAVHSDQFKNQLRLQNYHAQFELRLTDETRTYKRYGSDRIYINNFDKKPINFGPVFVLSYELEDNGLGRNMANYYNPDFAKTLPEATEVWQAYIKWNW